jgi:hypothetical protein|tara:strand:- start:2488 stop:3486 length:999 start_codon:yes stop_codon:yes gene_type:complete
MPKIYNPENTLDPPNCPTVEATLTELGSINTVPPRSGLYHNNVCGPELNFYQAPNESWIQREGSYIVLGTDRPTGVASGWGAQGAQIANSIDVVVGRMSSTRDGEGPEPGSIVNNSFIADAARVYISQLTDLDKNFGIEGTAMPSPGSGIGIKADGVRIIGREGVKIVTGTAKGFRGYGNDGETNSLGFPIAAGPIIELNAGNFSGEHIIPGGKFLDSSAIKAIQPVLLGGNTKDALRELLESVEDIQKATYQYARFNTKIINTIGMAFDALTAVCPPCAVPANICQEYVNRMRSDTINPLYHTRVNLSLWELNYLHPAGSKYICSRNVRTT